jgi:hypothetical protein
LVRTDVQTDDNRTSALTIWALIFIYYWLKHNTWADACIFMTTCFVCPWGGVPLYAYLTYRHMMAKTILALVLGDDHLILNGGAWQILSDQNIYSQLWIVLTENKFILHIKYSTDVFYFLLFSGRPSLFIFYGTMATNFYFHTFRARIITYKICQPPPLRIKWSSLYGIVNVLRNS